MIVHSQPEELHALNYFSLLMVWWAFSAPGPSSWNFLSSQETSLVP